MNRQLARSALIALAALIPIPCQPSVSVEDEEVVFRLERVQAEKVFLAGDFNAWNATIDLMVEGEQGFEIKLYLLPGTYRYRFMADGIAMRDPDNPCFDAEGNSCFTLVKRAGTLMVAFDEAAPTSAEASMTRVIPSARMSVHADNGSALIFLEGALRGAIDDAIDVDLAIGASEELRNGSRGEGGAFLVRSSASYRSDRGSLLVFERAPGGLEAGDPVGLIGLIGPYRYPVGLFARGVQYNGKLPLGLEAWFLFASRISGYRSGLETAADTMDIFSGRGGIDSDIWALKLGGKLGQASVRYLFRHNRRPREGVWQAIPFGSDINRGYERDALQGFWLSLPGDRGVVVDGELLFGRSFLSATDRWDAGEGVFREVSREAEWEHGHRLSAGVSRTGDRLRASLAFGQTTLEGDRRMRAGRPAGSRTSLAGECAFEIPSFSIAFQGTVEQYSTLNTGSTFWLARSNFWLDGDVLSLDLIPFLSSRQTYETKVTCAWNQECFETLPWGTGLRLQMTQRGEGANGETLLREIRLESGVLVHRRLTVLVDMRGVSYRYRGIERYFVDPHIALRGILTKSIWFSLAAGVNPYTFDRWRFAFSNHGREDYLLDRGVFQALAEHGEEASVKALIDAEEALADDWALTAQVGFTF